MEMITSVDDACNIANTVIIARVAGILYPEIEVENEILRNYFSCKNSSLICVGDFFHVNFNKQTPNSLFFRDKLPYVVKSLIHEDRLCSKAVISNVKTEVTLHGELPCRYREDTSISSTKVEYEESLERLISILMKLILPYFMISDFNRNIGLELVRDPVLIEASQSTLQYHGKGNNHLLFIA